MMPTDLRVRSERARCSPRMAIALSAKNGDRLAPDETSAQAEARSTRSRRGSRRSREEGRSSWSRTADRRAHARDGDGDDTRWRRRSSARRTRRETARTGRAARGARPAVARGAACHQRGRRRPAWRAFANAAAARARRGLAHEATTRGPRDGSATAHTQAAAGLYPCHRRRAAARRRHRRRARREGTRPRRPRAVDATRPRHSSSRSSKSARPHRRLVDVHATAARARELAQRLGDGERRPRRGPSSARRARAWAAGT